MIRFRLHILMAEKGPGRPYKIKEVAEGAKLSEMTVSGIYHNRYKRMDLETLDKLCVFFESEPGDFLQHIPDPE